MQRNLLGVEAFHRPLEHPLSRRRTRTAYPSAGFFTLGIGIAVLAAGLLFAGAMGQLDVAKSASAPTQSELAGERAQPAGRVKTEDAGNVVISEAPTESPNRNQASGGATSMQQPHRRPSVGDG
jgi:hypothetical protein